jgi:ubiquinol-cytochrome c reductase cytochrome b subunit
VKDVFAIAVFAVLFAYLVFYAPNYLGHADNYIPANPLQTPPHIVPEWYFLPFYAILRAIPDKLGGVIAMVGAIVILFFIPWLDTSRVRSTSYRPIYKWFFWLFVFTCLALGYLGAKPAEGWYVVASQVFTAYYFLHFLVVMPVVGIIETPRPLPGSVAETIYGRETGVGPQPQAVPAE